MTEVAESLLDSVVLDGPEEPAGKGDIVASEAELRSDDSVVPHIDSPDWTAYVLAELRPNEVYDGRPTYAGVRRLATSLLGVIIDTVPTAFQSPNPANKHHSCVGVSMTIDHPADYYWLGAYAGRTVRYGDLSDVFPADDKDYFGWHHSSATATTRTKARVLRDAFRLVGVYLREEVAEGHQDLGPKEEFMNGVQARTIDLLCSKGRLNIDGRRYLVGVWRHVEPNRKGGYDDLNQVPHHVAGQALRRIQTWQQKDGREKIPEELRGKYVPGWTDGLECMK